MLAPGTLVGGKYRVLRSIGEGGMGAVYEARHEGLGAAVALKVLHQELASRPVLAARFLREARIAATLESPHVARVTDVGELPDGVPFLVMELLRGESLQQVLERRGRVSRDEAIDYALQILSALESAHVRGVVHRDLKPDNVFVTPSPGGPLLKLLDFGIAKLTEPSDAGGPLTRADALLGTPEYMAPEQRFGAASVDPRADVYSAGAILHELLTGERPGDAASPWAALRGPDPAASVRLDPSVEPGVREVLQRALAVAPASRYPSARELRLALAAHAGALSHAGRLAAEPTPATFDPALRLGEPSAHTGDAPAPAAAALAPLAPGGAEPPPATPRLASAPPPADGAGATTPPTLLAAAAGGAPASVRAAAPATAPAMGAPAVPAVTAAGATAPGLARPGESSAASRGAFGLGAGGPRLGASLAPPPPPARSGGGARGWVVALLVAAAASTGAAALLVALRDRDDAPPPPTPTDPGNARGPAGPTELPVSTAAPPVAPPVPTRRGADRPPRTAADAGAGDAGLALPALPLPLPSVLPPLPSGFPTALPTGWPPLPGFPPPGPSP